MRFALIADCHIGEERPYEGVVRKLSRYALPFINQIIDEVTAKDVDFIVQLGDLIEDGANAQEDLANYSAGIEAFKKAPMPVLHVIGNHEQIHLTVPQLCAVTQEQPYYCKVIGGYKLITLFSSSVEHTDIHVDKTQISWLKERLSEGSEPVFVFIHHPLDQQSLAGNVWFEEYPDYCFCEERLELRQILEGSGKVLAVFGGHVHQNSMSFINGIYYITVQSLVERVAKNGAESVAGSGAGSGAESGTGAGTGSEFVPSRSYAIVEVEQETSRLFKIEVFGNDPFVSEIA